MCRVLSFLTTLFFVCVSYDQILYCYYVLIEVSNKCFVFYSLNMYMYLYGKPTLLNKVRQGPVKVKIHHKLV